MPDSALLAARQNYQHAAVTGMDMAQSGRDPGTRPRPGPAPEELCNWVKLFNCKNRYC